MVSGNQDRPERAGLPKKGDKTPVLRSPAQVETARKAEVRAAREADAKRIRDREQVLAQIINLQIAGHTLDDIGAQIGMSAADLDTMLMRDAGRYIKTQPQLRTYVRHWISGKMHSMIEANLNAATDPTHKDKLENQDRVVKMLNSLAKLHGADAPTQTEVKIEAAPEAVEQMVSALAARAGQGYDAGIFDAEVVEDIEEAARVSEEALAVTEMAMDLEEEDDGN